MSPGHHARATAFRGVRTVRHQAVSHPAPASTEIAQLLEHSAPCRGWAEQDEGPYHRNIEPVSHRSRRLPIVPRRGIGPQRRPHRVPRHLHEPRALLDRQALRSMEPPDLCPVFH
jgi:hypothetical protein